MVIRANGCTIWLAALILFAGNLHLDALAPRDSTAQTACIRTWSRSDWHNLALLLVLASLAFLPGLSAFGILDPSDGLYTEGAREMVESGNYITPHLNYQNFFEKPILIYWLIAGSFKLFGISPFSARLPVAISGMLAPLAMYVFSRYLLRRRAAFLTAMALLTSGLFLVVGHIAITDVPLTTVTVVAMMSLLLFRRENRPRWLITFYAALGISILLKGFVLVGETAFCLIVYEFAKKLILRERLETGWWLLIKRLQPWFGLVLVALIALPWYLAVDRDTHGQFTQEFFINQHLGRLTGTVNHANNPWWFYWPILVGGLFPWSLLLLLSAPLLMRPFRERKQITTANDVFIFNSCWAVVVLFLFNAVKTKLATYILPAFPPLCLITGLLLDRWIIFKTPALRKFASPLYVVSVLGLAGFLFKFQGLFKNLDQVTLAITWFGLASFLVTTATFAWNLRKKQVKTAVYQLAFGSLLAAALLVPSALMLTYQASHAGLLDLLQLARQAHANLAFYQRVSPAAAFYMREEVPVLTSVEAVESYRRAGSAPHYVLCSEDTVNRFKLLFKPKTLVTFRNKLYLFSFD